MRPQPNDPPPGMFQFHAGPPVFDAAGVRVPAPQPPKGPPAAGAAAEQIEALDRLMRASGTLPVAMHQRVIAAMNQGLAELVRECGGQAAGTTHSQLLAELRSLIRAR